MTTKKSTRRVVILGETDFYMVPLSSIVEEAGMKPVVCEDLAAAREAMAGWARPPVAIVVNLSTLAFDGGAVLDAIAGDRPDEDAPLLVCIDHVWERTDRARLDSLGVDLVVDKSTTPAELGGALRRLLFGVDDQSEHRKDPRVATCFPVEFRQEGRLASGYCVSLSAGGMFVQARHPATLGARIDVRFGLGSAPDPLEARARVVYTSRRDEPGTGPKGPPGMGLKFEELPQDTRRAIDAHLGPALAEALPPAQRRARRGERPRR